MANLYELAGRLDRFGAGELSREEIERWLSPILASDPLDVEESESAPWEDAPDEERLFWRLVFLLETASTPEDTQRALARRVVACLAGTGSPADTLELLPVIADQERFCSIAERLARGVISRTGFLSVIAESGYPPHMKLWLEHASARALELLCERLERGAYGEVARMVERAPP